VKISVIHGPNLRVLGRREPEVYGHATLDDIDRALADLAARLDVRVETFQSNAEGAILDRLEEVSPDADGILINPGGLTHTSVSLRDGLAATGLPFVEVHLSNVHARERFRRHSYLAPIALGVVSGFGLESYLLGLRGLVTHLRSDDRA
jgi:3-dehydroquinate dehydratase-2